MSPDAEDEPAAEEPADKPTAEGPADEPAAKVTDIQVGGMAMFAIQADLEGNDQEEIELQQLDQLRSEPEAPACSEDAGEGVAVAVLSPSWKKIRLGVKVSSKLSHKVCVANKIGGPPDGYLRDLCACIQEGFHQALEKGTSQVESHGAAEKIPGFRMELLHEELFVRVRNACQVNPTEFKAALAPPNDQGTTNLSAIGTAQASGKSSAFFLLSSDQRYVIKSMTEVDFISLRNVLSDYTEHVESHPNSLLPRFLGLFELTVADGQSYNLVVMTNFFAGMLPIHYRFDLKGSTHNRIASEQEKAKGVLAILKDQEWTDTNRKIQFPNEQSVAQFVDVLQLDSEWLSTHELIDYSLLVGVHSRSRAREELGKQYRERPEYMHVYTLDDGEDVLYIGIVDILQPYTARKACETFCCGSLFCGRDISCQPPHKYASRFLDFFASNCATTSVSELTIAPPAIAVHSGAYGKDGMDEVAKK